jgi:hypothetical protein
LGSNFPPHNVKIDVIIQNWMRQCDMITGHIVPHPRILREVEDWKVIFLHRDPRDTIVSMRYHWEKRPIWSPHSSWEQDGMDWHDPYMWLIENIKPWYDTMMQWTELADYVVEYENLINLPHPQIEVVSDALGLEYDEVVKRSKDKVGRFRKGGSGGWEAEFYPRHIEAYERIWLEH